MKKDILKIDIQKVNENYSVVTIVEQDEEVLKRGKFCDVELKVESKIFPYIYLNYEGNEIFSLKLRGTDKERDNLPTPIPNNLIPQLKEIVKTVNEKYGIEVGWRPKKNKIYYCVDLIRNTPTQPYI